MKPPMNQTCMIVPWTRNIYGDLVNTGGSATEISCKFREITNFETTSANREEFTSNAMLWTNPDESLDIGSIILFDGIYYRVTDVTKARKLHDEAVQFLKCLVERLKDVANVS